MSDFDDLKDLLRVGRKISGSIYLAYRADRTRRGKAPKPSKAEQERERQIRQMRRSLMGRIGPMAALPFLVIGPLMTSMFSVFTFDLITIGALVAAMMGFFYGLFELRLALKLEADEREAEARSNPAPKGRHGPHKLSGLALFAGAMAAFSFAGNGDVGIALGFGLVTSLAVLWAVGPQGLWPAGASFARSARPLPSRPLHWTKPWPIRRWGPR